MLSSGTTSILHISYGGFVIYPPLEDSGEEHDKGSLPLPAHMGRRETETLAPLSCVENWLVQSGPYGTELTQSSLLPADSDGEVGS